MNDPQGAAAWLQFVPIFVLTLPMAFGAFWLAPKMGANRWLWLIVLLIPFVNFIAYTIFFFRIAGAMLDRLNAIKEQAKF